MSAFLCDDDLFQEILNRLVRDHTRTRGYKLVSCLLHRSKIFRDVVRDIGSSDVDETEKLAEQVVCDWMWANHMAVEGRYPDPGMREEMNWRNHAPSAPFLKVQFMTKVIGLHQLYKHLQCLHYQCSESLPANTPQEDRDRFAAVYEEIEKAKNMVAAAIVEGSPEYACCGWGDSDQRTPAAYELERMV
jgi:hypothetical protein